jgi:hypothetical protein
MTSKKPENNPKKMEDVLQTMEDGLKKIKKWKTTSKNK